MQVHGVSGLLGDFAEKAITGGGVPLFQVTPFLSVNSKNSIRRCSTTHHLKNLECLSCNCVWSRQIGPNADFQRQHVNSKNSALLLAQVNTETKLGPEHTARYEGDHST